MKTITVTLFAIINVIALPLNAQTPLVGTGSGYSNIFSPSDQITYDVPGTGLINVNVRNGTATKISGPWELAAQGGMNFSLAGLGLTESAARTSLTGTGLQFSISNDPNSLLGELGSGLNVHYGWRAEARFDTSGVLNYQPNTIYNISFNVAGNGGLLNAIANVTPQFTFELIDGNGNALSSLSSGSLINVAGLLGANVGNGTVNLNYLVNDTVPSGPMGVRFTGDAIVGASVLNLGTTFATVTNLNITATPVPEPGGAALLGTVGVICLLRRRRHLGMA